MQEKLAYTVKEACNTLSLGKSKFYDLVQAGELRIFKVGKKSLVARDELTRFVASAVEASPR